VLLQPLVRDGEIVGREPLAAARSRHRESMAELPAHARRLARGYPAIPTLFGPNGDGPEADPDPGPGPAPASG
jgi:nicotinate phosphoribosyltransferase